MGYKLCGWDVSDANDLDPKMAAHYVDNLHPQNMHIKPVIELADMDLGTFEVLDGSPPCSTFSKAGDREKNWGVKRKFREGQAAQVLDDLFFDWIKVAAVHRPKVVIAENVTGLVLGAARGYLRMIVDQLRGLGYGVEVVRLDASGYGVPQRRQRIFICGQLGGGVRLSWPKPSPVISVADALSDVVNTPDDLQQVRRNPGTSFHHWYGLGQPGSSYSDIRRDGQLWNSSILPKADPAYTLATRGTLYHYDEYRSLTAQEYGRLSSFPADYRFQSHAAGKYVCSMSVPPFLSATVASVIQNQWLT